MDLGPHAAFIVASYVAAAFIVVGLLAWVALDYRRQLRVLADLEQQGITRRSDRPAGETA